MRTLAGAALLSVLIAFHVGTSAAQSSDEPDLRREIEALRAAQEALRQELQEIRSLISPRPAGPPSDPRDIVLGIDGAPVRGDAQARLVLVDFSDYQ